ncbi:MAG: tetratricopeptide repeat protein, partial [Lentimicrobiaceae bacterium]|nr:tetratricopeptide repeat protein [Lentimicrobiaceae bacterium]
MKNSFLICLHLLPIMALTTMGQTISSFNKLPKQQLLDTANYFFDQNSTDMALACYSSIINTPVKDADVEQQQIIVEAYNKAAAIYYYMCDYKSAYEFLIKALLLCEKYNYLSYESTIYNNIGNIYYHFKQYDIAKYYYEKALNLCNDSTRIIMILNNLGAIELEIGTLDSAFFYLNQSLQISKTHNDMHLHTILNTIASIYKKSKQYNSALKYFKLALNEAEK